MDAEGIATAIASLVCIVGYYALAGWWVHRRRAVAAEPAPSSMLSPASLRYLDRNGFDGLVLLAAIVDLIDRGALSLRQRPDGGQYLEPALSAPPEVQLSDDGRLVHAALFRAGNRTVDLGDLRDTAITDAAITLRDWLKQHFLVRPQIARPVWYALLAAGVALTAVAIVLTAATPLGYGGPQAAALFGFFIVGLVAIAAAPGFVRASHGISLVLRLIVAFLLLSVMGALLLLVGSGLIEFHELHGLAGIAVFAMPVFGTWFLIRMTRPSVALHTDRADRIARMRREPAARRVPPEVTAPADAAESDGATERRTTRAEALALGLPEPALEPLARIFDALSLPAERAGLFGTRGADAADLGSFGHMATR